MLKESYSEVVRKNWRSHFPGQWSSFEGSRQRPTHILVWNYHMRDTCRNVINTLLTSLFYNELDRKEGKRTVQWSRVLLLTHPLVLCGWNHADLTSLDSIFLTCQVGIIHTLQGTHTYIHDTHTLQGLLWRSSQRATVSSTEKCAIDMHVYSQICLYMDI